MRPYENLALVWIACNTKISILISWLSNHAYSNLRMFQYLSGLSDQLSQRWRSEKYWHRKSMIFNLPHTLFTYCQITSLLFSVSPSQRKSFFSVPAGQVITPLAHPEAWFTRCKCRLTLGDYPRDVWPNPTTGHQSSHKKHDSSLPLTWGKFSRRQLWRSCRMQAHWRRRGRGDITEYICHLF